MTFGLTPEGFSAMRLADTKLQLDNAMIAQYGDVNIDPQSVFGQFIGVLSKMYADDWENMEDVYLSMYPGSASGVSLDNVVQLNGITRLPETQTSVIGVCTAIEQTSIPAGSLVAVVNTTNVFSNPITTIITRDNAYSVNVDVVAAAAQVYTVFLNNISYIYSLPVITFTGGFVAGNSIVVTINGVQQTAVPYNTSSSQTVTDIASMIATNAAVASATASAGNIISIVPNSGFSVTINSISITGGVSQPTYAITFAIPTVNNISSYLAAVINAASGNYTATDNTGSFTITSTSPSVPFAASVQTNLQITSQSSPVNFLAVNYGPIPCPANTLTVIQTPVSGWSSITNPVQGVTGTFVETDSQLRIRRANSIALAGNATVEAIRAHLLQNVPGVTSALVFENQTVFQNEIDIIFSGALISGNTITIELNDRVLPTITYATSNAFTMGLLATQLSQQPEVATCTVGGVGNNTLMINMNLFQEVIIESVTIGTNTNNTTVSIQGGRTPKSFEAVVEGGTDAAIGEEIWLSKPAGTTTFGNTTVDITDSMGNTQVIFFSRPTPVYIWVEVTLTLDAQESFPTNGLQLVQQAILNYGNSLGVGLDVILQRVLCQIFTVPGVAHGDMQIAATYNIGNSPSYGTSDIDITDVQISIWNVAQITVTL